MQETISYRTSISSAVQLNGSGIEKPVLENAIIVFARQGCCMCHVIKRLLLSHGVNPPVFEVEEKEEADVVDQLLKMNNGATGGDKGGGVVLENLPAVVVGGKLFGGLERVMGAHITGELVPILKDAGALWL
ncbi:putative glutaredoxin grx [Tripterygium wilfordii]|uniref:Putative glutaredoxin grx n=1 Tax=Tripterygium wilfordii TaxID=458696 RepID=A0A7J7C4R4_TRIWF|nr:glutaredoxin-C9-like [Tripterygium wilfordii]KAF5729121.1 putative glutaredoxin grx [Tripterygium wilfordii]